VVVAEEEEEPIWPVHVEKDEDGADFEVEEENQYLTVQD
jgi:hypothetical protein